MPFFETTRFQGTLAGHGSSVPVNFEASIDDLGELQLVLDRMPFSREADALHVDRRPGTSVDHLSIEGSSEAGHVLRSDTFFITSSSHSSQHDEELSYQGKCAEAQLRLPPSAERDLDGDARVWRLRQFRTFRRIAHETPLGRVVIGGPLQDQETQEPSGFLAVSRPEDADVESWWIESEELLTHVARVLSFACDTYLRPIIEQRFEGGECTVRILRQGRASSPFMAPFHELHMQPIFAHACESYFTRRREIADLDAAIRWLTAPAVYDESRLINAMSALENILNRCGLEEVDNFMRSSPFKKVAKRVRELLTELQAPEGMRDKIPELNRPALDHKIRAFLRARGIMIDDMPEGWLDAVIGLRNRIIHTGVSADFAENEPDTFDHIIWAREIVTRITLERLGFVGAYRSWLHHDEQFHFPECVPVQEWVARPNAAQSEA